MFYPTLVETMPSIVATVKGFGWTREKKFGSFKESFYFSFFFAIQKMKLEEKRMNEEWDQLMNSHANIADTYHRELERKKV